MGGLIYSLSGFFGPGGQFCPQSAFSTSDPELVLPPAGFPAGGAFMDLAPDRTVDPPDTLSFSINLGECARENQVPFEVGDSVGLILRAYAGATLDSTEQQFIVTRR